MERNATTLRKALGAWRWWLPFALGALAPLFIVHPSWKAARNSAEQAELLELQMQELENWGETGSEILERVRSRSEAAEERWTLLFPESKQVDLLFLELARIADDCELRDFHLAEVAKDMESVEEEEYDDEMMDEGEVDHDAEVRAAAKLSDFRVEASFYSDLRSAARFLAGLEGIPRAIKVDNVVIRDTGKGLLVELEMELYVSSQTNS